MNGISPTTAFVMVVSVVSQLAGASLLPATRGFMAPLPTVGCVFGIGFGTYLLARLMTQGAPLSMLLPVTAVMMQITGVLVGVFAYGESASLSRMACLIAAAVLVGAAGFL